MVYTCTSILTFLHLSRDAEDRYVCVLVCVDANSALAS